MCGNTPNSYLTLWHFSAHRVKNSVKKHLYFCVKLFQNTQYLLKTVIFSIPYCLLAGKGKQERKRERKQEFGPNRKTREQPTSIQRQKTRLGQEGMQISFHANAKHLRGALGEKTLYMPALSKRSSEDVTRIPANLTTGTEIIQEKQQDDRGRIQHIDAENKYSLERHGIERRILIH